MKQLAVAMALMTTVAACNSGDDGGPCDTTCQGTRLTASMTIDPPLLENAVIMLCREMNCVSGSLGAVPGDGEQEALTLQDCFHVVLTVTAGNESWAFAPVSDSTCDVIPQDGEEFRFVVAKLGGMTLFNGTATADDQQSTLCDGTLCHTFDIDITE